MVNDSPHPHPTTRARHTLHVPTFDISGAAAPRALINWIEDRLVDMGGGFTRLSASGGWKNPDGSTSRDDLLIYLVDLDDASPLALGAIAQRVAVDLHQDTVYLTVQTLDVVHVHAVVPTPPYLGRITSALIA